MKKWKIDAIEEFLRKTNLDIRRNLMHYGLKEVDKILELKQWITEEIKNSDEPITIIAHSFGGVIAYSLDDTSYSKVDCIITLASPIGFGVNILSSAKKIGFRKDIHIKKQLSVGFLLDVRVPFFMCKYPETEFFLFLNMHDDMYRNSKLLKRALFILELYNI